MPHRFSERLAKSRGLRRARLPATFEVSTIFPAVPQLRCRSPAKERRLTRSQGCLRHRHYFCTEIISGGCKLTRDRMGELSTQCRDMASACQLKLMSLFSKKGSLSIRPVKGGRVFVELMPLLGERAVMITVARLNQNSIRINVIPSRKKTKTRPLQPL